MQASLEQNIHNGIEEFDRAADPRGILLCVLALI